MICRIGKPVSLAVPACSVPISATVKSLDNYCFYRCESLLEVRFARGSCLERIERPASLSDFRFEDGGCSKAIGTHFACVCRFQCLFGHAVWTLFLIDTLKVAHLYQIFDLKIEVA